MKFFNLLFLLLLLTACKSYSDDQMKQFDTEIQTFLKKKKWKFEVSPSGLYYHIDKEGSGPSIKYTDRVTFKYTGKFLSGQTFDVSEKPVTFEVRELIPAWKELLLEIQPGSKVRMICPPQLGYGTSKMKNVPPNSILFFELEVIEAK